MGIKLFLSYFNKHFLVCTSISVNKAFFMKLKIADIPEKLKNTHISSLGSDGLHWTVVTYS